MKKLDYTKPSLQYEDLWLNGFLCTSIVGSGVDETISEDGGDLVFE